MTNPDTSIANKATGQEAIVSRLSAASNGRRRNRPMLSGSHTLTHCPQTRQSALLWSFAGLSRLGQLRASALVRLQVRTQPFPAQLAHLSPEAGRIASIAPRP